MELDDPHSRYLRLHRLSDDRATFFVTKCIQPPRPVLNAELRQVVCSAFCFAVGQKRIILRAFVVMPDHWHGVFGLLDNWTLPDFMHSFMSFVGAKTLRRIKTQGCCWQEGYYDTRIRSVKQFEYVARYILDNPVRKELVTSPEKWHSCSLNCPEFVTDPWPWAFEKD